MWFNESAPYVKSDMFVVQAMPGVSRVARARALLAHVLFVGLHGSSGCLATPSARGAGVGRALCV